MRLEESEEIWLRQSRIDVKTSEKSISAFSLRTSPITSEVVRAEVSCTFLERAEKSTSALLLSIAAKSSPLASCDNATPDVLSWISEKIGARSICFARMASNILAVSLEKSGWTRLSWMACRTGAKSTCFAWMASIILLASLEKFGSMRFSRIACRIGAKSTANSICWIASSTGDKSIDTLLLDLIASMTGDSSFSKSMSLFSRIASSTGEKSTSGCSCTA
mmetsp:Transcript_136302/g.339883  ORF Transcript_136302/g.339883 Transcript_136302/m.339883 type:complete len:221 (+) Transcript_136302:1410-2072(+)